MRNGFDAYGIEKILAYYRIVGRSNKLKVIRGVWRAYRDSEKLNVIKSSCCIINYIFNALLKRI